MTQINITLENEKITFQCDQPSISQFKPITDDIRDQFKQWIERYQKASKDNKRDDLLAIGKEIYLWLEELTANQMDEVIKNNSTPPLFINFCISSQPILSQDDGKTDELLFLEVPWELAANENGYLSHQFLQYCPIRRLGTKGNPQDPSDFRLSMVFMAASPRDGGPELKYEDEETAILKVIGNKGIDLTVEESGNIKMLAECMADYNPVDVLHISCHGNNDPIPYLILETDEGNPEPVDPIQFSQSISANKPRLLFLSACKTSEPDTVLNTYSTLLIQQGFPALLGWGSSVYDSEATLFASYLYEYLSQSDTLENAVAKARYNLIYDPNREQGKQSEHWHLARLYLGSEGGGILSQGKKVRQLTHIESGHKEFLNTKDKEVPVASRYEFVGRRRLIQKILRELRSINQEHAGVLLHGTGHIGKSSLAARIANRLKDHQTIVIFKHYDAPCILNQIESAVAKKEVREVINTHRESVNNDHALLYETLHDLLTGPFAQSDRNDNGGYESQPILLIIDDFERALEPPKTPGGFHEVKPEYVKTLQAIINAFHAGGTQSRLLITCRYPFIIRDQNRNLADYLLQLPLYPLSDNERQKQLFAKINANNVDTKDLMELFARCMKAGQGNPGLQDLLFTLCLESAEDGKQALDEIEAYIKTGDELEQQKLVDFIKNLILDDLLNLLSDKEKQLLRYSTAFSLPIPTTALQPLADSLKISPKHPYGERLIGFTLWEPFEDLVDHTQTAVLPNKLVVSKLEPLTAEEFEQTAKTVINPLFQSWGGEDTNKRPAIADYELTRLAIPAKNSNIITTTATDAVFWLNQEFEYRTAAQIAIDSIQVLDESNTPIPIQLLRLACEYCQQIGEVNAARQYIERAIARIEQDKDEQTISKNEKAGIYLTHARLLMQSGEPDLAHKHLKIAAELFDELKDDFNKAVTMGDIANILYNKGDVEQALLLHQERLDIMEALGDKREKTIAMGDIANILYNKGDVEQALLLHQEEMKVYEALDDRRSKAVTMGEIANIHNTKGDVEQALLLHQEEMKVYEALGDRRSKAVTMGEIADILNNKGDVEQALLLHQERLDIMEALDDRREKALAMGDIANILNNKGDVEQALLLHQEAMKVYEALGDRRSKAVTMGDIANILNNKGNVEQALLLHQERLTIFEKLEGQSEIANTLWGLAKIERQQEKYQEAFDHLAKSYEINMQIGRLEGICFVGLDLGILLCQVQNKEQGIPILQRSLEGFQHLGWENEVKYTQEAIDFFSKEND